MHEYARRVVPADDCTTISHTPGKRRHHTPIPIAGHVAADSSNGLAYGKPRSGALEKNREAQLIAARDQRCSGEATNEPAIPDEPSSRKDLVNRIGEQRIRIVQK